MIFFSQALCLRQWTQAKDEMGVKQELKEDGFVVVFAGDGWGLGGGVSEVSQSHVWYESRRGRAPSKGGWWNLFTEPNEADEMAIYGITFHLHFVQPPDQKTALIWGLHQ